MQSPFDSNTSMLYVISNDEEQYSLWPDFQPVPAGWVVRHGPDSRAACLEFVERHWTDMRPRSVRESTAADRSGK